jgi:hypothetical protein
MGMGMKIKTEVEWFYDHRDTVLAALGRLAAFHFAHRGCGWLSMLKRAIYLPIGTWSVVKQLERVSKIEES